MEGIFYWLYIGTTGKLNPINITHIAAGYIYNKVALGLLNSNLFSLFLLDFAKADSQNTVF